MKHITPTDLERLRSRAATAREAETIGAHVAQCPECRFQADAYLELSATVTAFKAVFSSGDDAQAAEERTSALDGLLEEASHQYVATEPRSSSWCARESNDVRRWRSHRKRRAWIAGAVVAAVAVLAVLFLRPDANTDRETGGQLAVRPSSDQPSPSPDVTRPGTAPVKVVRPEWDALVSEVRKTSRLPFPDDIRELSIPDMFRGQPNDGVPIALSPSATALDQLRPRLDWDDIDAASYVVTVTCDGAEVVRSSRLTASAWRVPVSLRRGRTYRWQVTVHKGGESFVVPLPPAPPAVFKVVTLAQHQDLVNAAEARGDDHLLMAVLYARAGVRDEARRALQEYQQASNDPLAEILLRQLPSAP